MGETTQTVAQRLHDAASDKDEAQERIGPTQMAVVLARYPRLMDRMAIELAELVREVTNNDQGKSGELTLKITVERPKASLNLKGRELFVKADIKVKTPSDAPSSQIFYFDDDGGLHMQDPYQRPMFDGPREV